MMNTVSRGTSLYDGRVVCVPKTCVRRKVDHERRRRDVYQWSGRIRSVESEGRRSLLQSGGMISKGSWYAMRKCRSY